MTNSLIRFFLENKLVAFLLMAMIVVAGLITVPFAWAPDFLPRDPVSVDAIPDIGENQQIVFTDWMGRSPQDIEDQITYPLTSALAGIPGVKTIRSTSMPGFSSIYVIFDDEVEYYWSRTRILEKLNALPPGLLPDDVKPALGPDATALGQVFWYTIEGRDEQGRPAPGWDPHEIRTVQDFQVKFALQSAEGVAEVAAIGGHVREYQVDVDPDALLAAGVSVLDVYAAVQASNLDVGARTIELNQVEYLIRGLGFIESVADLEEAVVAVRDDVPIRVRDVARVSMGPAERRGALDKAGVEAVGGVVTTRYGANPMAVIEAVKARIDELAPGLPERRLEDGRLSKLTIVPYYDRSGLIGETVATLETALLLQVLITVIVVLVMVGNLRSGVLITSVLPVSVLLTFVAMKVFGVEANIVALSGIAIAIGTMVDMGVILTENILKHLDEAEPGESYLEVIFRAASEVGSAVLAAVGTTIISFLPVFYLEGAEGKLFGPLAYTKTFALAASILVTLLLVPAVAHLLYRKGVRSLHAGGTDTGGRRGTWLAAAAFTLLLGTYWRPLGESVWIGWSLVFTAVIVAGLLFAFLQFERHYGRMLAWTLRHKLAFLTVPALVLLGGIGVWRGLGKEFMPTLDEGAFLLMPTTLPHAGIEVALDRMRIMDRRIASIPEVENVVGKMGRVESALDPAPIGMYETLITYKPEFGTDSTGKRIRNWRDHIRTPEDIWAEIAEAAKIPGVTSAPKLQPIETRLVMLQTGMRAPMGVKISGTDLATIEAFGLDVERVLKEVDGVNPAAVFADRIVGKPYLEIEWNRQELGRYGITIAEAQMLLETAVGGIAATTTVEGRERYPVRVRYAREYRDNPDALARILVPAMGGAQVPLGQLADIRYVRGPMEIRSENSFLTGYVLFDRHAGVPEVTAVEAAADTLQARIDRGELVVPNGVSYRFAGTFENQVRAEKRLMVLIPLVLTLIFLVLYLQFRRSSTAFIVFTGIAVAWAGGFLLIGLYAQPWFADFSVAGVNMRDLFQVGPVNLSIAVWVGFIALFGIAVDDGVVMATYLDQRFQGATFANRDELRAAVLEAGLRRIRPCLMTTATTLLALLPVLTSTGKGSDIMVPMAIPAFGGMAIELLTLFIVPVLYSWRAERRLLTT